MASVMRDEQFRSIVEEAMVARIRRDLKAKLMATLEAEVDVVVDLAVKDMQPRLQVMVDERMRGFTAHLLVSRREKEAGK